MMYVLEDTNNIRALEKADILLNSGANIDLKDKNGKGIGTVCEFEIPYFELY